jgi:predicted ester cyclase
MLSIQVDHQEGREPMTLAVTKTQQIIADALNGRNIAAVDDAFEPDCSIHVNGGPKRDLTLPEFKDMLAGMLTAFPDLHLTVDDQFTVDDRVATRWTIKGPHDGPLGPLGPSGKRVTIEGIIMDRYVDSKITERWELWDQAWLLQQLDVL